MSTEPDTECGKKKQEKKNRRKFTEKILNKRRINKTVNNTRYYWFIRCLFAVYSLFISRLFGFFFRFIRCLLAVYSAFFFGLLAVYDALPRLETENFNR